MRNFGETLQRLMALLLTLALLPWMPAAQAQSVPDWQQLAIEVSWLNADGSKATALAEPVPGSLMQEFWVTVDPLAIREGVWLKPSHPSANYTYTPDSETRLTLVMDAASVDGRSYQMITAGQNGRIVDMYYLYISTQPMPVSLSIDVPVVYKDIFGNVVAETTYLCPPNVYTLIDADEAMVPGYRIRGETSKGVYVDGDVPKPAVIEFTCEWLASAVDVPVCYRDMSGMLLARYTVSCQPNQDTTIRADAAWVPGYRIVGQDQATVWVDSHGASPAEVVFQCELEQPEPVWTPEPTQAPAQPQHVTVLYRDESGAVIHETTVFCAANEYTAVLADSNLVPGYRVIGQDWAEVWVDANGAHPATVVFECERIVVETPAPTTVPVSPVDVPVVYLDEYGSHIYATTARCYPDQPNAVLADLNVIPGYNVVSQGWVEVQVSAHGAEPEQVVFRCARIAAATKTPAQAVNVPVFYVDERDDILHETSVSCQMNQTSVIVADASLVPGYRITGQSRVEVWVDSNGALPAVVVFDCQRTAQAAQTPTSKPAASVRVPVIYRDTNGATLHETAVECPPGQLTVIRAEANRVPGYSILGREQAEVWVDASGATPERVIFECMQESASSPSDAVFSAQVMVVYQTDRGLPLDTQYVTCYQGQENIIRPNSPVVSGYQLISADHHTITVDAWGTPSQQLVTFVYEAEKQPVTVDISVFYRIGNTIMARETRQVTEGADNRISPDLSRVPSGYVLEDTSAVQVTVNSQGRATPEQIIFYLRELPRETPIPQGEMINRLGRINAARTAVRRIPSTKDNDPVQRLAKESMVYVLREEINESGEAWLRVLIDNAQYFILSDLVDVLSSGESEQYMSMLFATPVPPMTAEQIDFPQGAVSPSMPTAEILPPTIPELLPTAAPQIYQGYALTTQRVALRTTVGDHASDILMMLDAQTLVVVSQPGYDPVTGAPWSVVTTLDKTMGMLPDSSLRRISEQEAQYYLSLWEQAKATPIPTLPPTNTPAPAQVQGYAVSVGDHVPYRNMPSEFSVIMGELMRDEVVYVSGQQYVDGVAWHLVQYGTQWIYVRADMLRMMSPQELEDYLSYPEETPAPTLVVEPQPYDPAGMSSYGYVWDTSVNFRKSPSTSASRIRTLKQYAFCLVLGSSRQSDGVWYHIDYNGTEGYVHGDYFKQMTINELERFLNSDEYLQGITNNTTTNNHQNHTTGTGGIISAEDQIVNQWTDPNSGLNVSYAPFNPFATPAPLNEATPTLRPMATPAATNAPTLAPIPTLGPIYPTVEEEERGWPWGWLVAIVLLVAAGGGCYAWIKMREHKRMVAQRAAQRRAQAARAEARAYARSVPVQNRTGAYPPPQGVQSMPPRSYAPPVQGSAAPGMPPQAAYPERSNGYAPPANPSAAGRGATPAYREPTAPQQGNYTASYRPGGDTGVHAGRRTAYRQARYGEGDYTATYRPQPEEEQADH